VSEKIYFTPISQAFEGLEEQIKTAANRIARALGVPAVLFKNRELTITEKLDLYGWESVNPHHLNPEERWEYQKWILSSPRRWVKRIRNAI
jgi:hypothetical protein